MNWKIDDVEGLEEAVFELRVMLVERIGVRPDITIVDAGCGQGGFTAALSKRVGKKGKVLGIDVTDKYSREFWKNQHRWGAEQNVVFIQADVADMKGIVLDEVADMVVSYRMLEELSNCLDMEPVVREMTRICRRNGRVCLIELGSDARNEAERNYIRLHRESGDCFFEPDDVLHAIKDAGLKEVSVETFDTDIWFSPSIAKHDVELAQLWYDNEVEERLGPSIDRYGMKYPSLLVFSGTKK